MLKMMVKLLVVSLALFSCISNGIKWSDMVDTALKKCESMDGCWEIFGSRICWKTKEKILSCECQYEYDCVWLNIGTNIGTNILVRTDFFRNWDLDLKFNFVFQF
mmetsp:Transcript_44732/g.54768  ORF Transcript_44732/g.54768 Transcript_44732/m.54768 type:complete len:105 (+) Transcript_44732:53-367(+)